MHGYRISFGLWLIQLPDWSNLTEHHRHKWSNVEWLCMCLPLLQLSGAREVLEKSQQPYSFLIESIRVRDTQLATAKERIAVQEQELRSVGIDAIHLLAYSLMWSQKHDLRSVRHRYNPGASTYQVISQLWCCRKSTVANFTDERCFNTVECISDTVISTVLSFVVVDSWKKRETHWWIQRTRWRQTWKGCLTTERYTYVHCMYMGGVSFVQHNSLLSLHYICVE